MLYTGFEKQNKVNYRPTYLKELFPLNSGERNIDLLKIKYLILQKGRERQVLLCEIKLLTNPILKLKLLDKHVLDKPSLVEKLHIHNDRCSHGNKQLVCIEDQLLLERRLL